MLNNLRMLVASQPAVIRLPGAVPSGYIFAAGMLFMFYGVLGLSASQSANYSVMSSFTDLMRSVPPAT